MRLLLDLGAVFTGGAVLIWYLALGPAVGTGLRFDLFDLVTYAYPVGDLLLLFGILTLLWRGVPRSSVMALQIFAVGLLLFIAADLTYAYITVHSAYLGGDPVDTLWMLGVTAVCISAASQLRTKPTGTVVEAGGAHSRAAVFPALRGRPEQLRPAGLRRVAQRRVQPARRHPARRPGADRPGQHPSVHRPARLRPACGQVPAAGLDRRHHRPL